MKKWSILLNVFEVRAKKCTQRKKKKEIGLESALSRMRAQRRTKKDMNNKDRARKRTT
jgi:hypothetical protein